MAAKVIGWVSVVVLGVGLLVGLMPVSSGGSSCGSAFVESDQARVDDMVSAMNGRRGTAAAGCDSLRSVIRIPAIGLLVLGAIGGIAGITMGQQPARKPGQGQESSR